MRYILLTKSVSATFQWSEDARSPCFPRFQQKAWRTAETGAKKKVAIIGGGLSGMSAAKSPGAVLRTFQCLQGVSVVFRVLLRSEVFQWRIKRQPRPARRRRRRSAAGFPACRPPSLRGWLHWGDSVGPEGVCKALQACLGSSISGLSLSAQWSVLTVWGSDDVIPSFGETPSFPIPLDVLQSPPSAVEVSGRCRP